MAWVENCTPIHGLFHVLVQCTDIFSPIVPGHEIIGRVVAIGDSVSQWKIGDRIGGPWHGGHDGKHHKLVGYFDDG